MSFSKVATSFYNPPLNFVGKRIKTNPQTLDFTRLFRFVLIILYSHTKAMHIYEANNNLIYVRDFLGHANIKTTGIYAESSLSMKRKALEQISDSPELDIPSWQQSKDMMSWLKGFGKQKN